MSDNNARNNAPLLEVRDLRVHFPIVKGVIFKRTIGHIRAVDGVDFSIRKGETLGLVGESGCGKSTIARAVARLYDATGGKIVLNGKDLAKANPHGLLQHRKDIQMVFQDPYASLDPRMTVRDIIAEPMRIFVDHGHLRMTRTEINQRVEELMEKVGLNRCLKNRYPHEFSGGQRQRIGIARALALNPQLILADEPVSALDVSIQSQILNLLRDLQKEFHLTYLFIAHDLAVIKYVSDRVAVMYLGVIVETADSDTLYDEPLHPYTQALLSAIPIPDPEVEGRRNRIILTGDAPSPDEERRGCCFYARCPERMDTCAASIPRLEEVRPDHQTACFLYVEPTPESEASIV